MPLLLRVRPLHLTAFDSARAALLAAQQEAAQSRSLLRPVLGANVMTCASRTSTVVLGLSNSWRMQIGCGPTGVVWSVSDATRQPQDAADDFPRHIALSFPARDSQLDRYVVSWNRRDLLDRLIGNPIRSVQPSSPLLFLYADSCPMLCFGVLVQEESGSLVLHWDVDE